MKVAGVIGYFRPLFQFVLKSVAESAIERDVLTTFEGAPGACNIT